MPPRERLPANMRAAQPRAARARARTPAAAPEAAAEAPASQQTQQAGGIYFTSDKSHLKFISTGSTLLDCALGGGLAVGRVVNVVGDKSTGKTLLAIEAFANCAIAYPTAKMRYAEAESAFDLPYAHALGMPTDRVSFLDPDKPFETVEDFHADLKKFMDRQRGVGMYTLDSLDALSDDAELALVGQTNEDGSPKGSYGVGKAKHMSRMFRQIVRELEKSQLALMIISQIRDNIGVTFGKKYSRSGGRALDFYATHVIYLAHIKTLTRTIQNVKRPVGILVKAKVEKNKIGLPMREVEFPIMFGYGIDDMTACLTWLASVQRLAAVEPGLTAEKITRYINNKVREGYDAYHLAAKEVARVTKVVWREVEDRFVPTMGKYQRPES